MQQYDAEITACPFLNVAVRALDFSLAEDCSSAAFGNLCCTTTQLVPRAH